MPEMSGLEVQRELNRSGSMVPVILITGHGDIPMAVQAMKDGAFDFLQKPFRDQELLDRSGAHFSKMPRIDTAFNVTPNCASEQAH